MASIFSAFDQERSTIAALHGPDFFIPGDIEILFDGREQDLIGMCSPDIFKGPNEWVMIFNSWGQKVDSPNALFLCHIPGLTNVVKSQATCKSGTEDRVIDGAIAWVDDRWVMACKWWKQLRFAQAPQLDGPWQWVKEEKPPC